MKASFVCTLIIALTASMAPSAEPILCGVRPKASNLVVDGKTDKSANRDEPDSGKAAPSETPAAGAGSVAELIATLTPQERCSLLALLNSGSAEDLVEINGIAEVRARTILSSRPIFELEDLMLLRGFGPGLISKVVAHRNEAIQ